MLWADVNFPAKRFQNEVKLETEISSIYTTISVRDAFNFNMFLMMLFKYKTDLSSRKLVHVPKQLKTS